MNGVEWSGVVWWRLPRSTGRGRRRVPDRPATATPSPPTTMDTAIHQSLLRRRDRRPTGNRSRRLCPVRPSVVQRSAVASSAGAFCNIYLSQHHSTASLVQRHTPPTPTAVRAAAKACCVGPHHSHSFANSGPCLVLIFFFTKLILLYLYLTIYQITN